MKQIHHKYFLLDPLNFKKTTILVSKKRKIFSEKKLSQIFSTLAKNSFNLSSFG